MVVCASRCAIEKLTNKKRKAEFTINRSERKTKLKKIILTAGISMHFNTQAGRNILLLS